MKIKLIFTFLFICGTITLLFLGYLYFIGIPKTRARNFYNLAIQAEAQNNKMEAITYLETAKHYWAEEYIVKKLVELQNIK